MAYSNYSWSTWNSWDSSAHPSQQGNWWSSTDWQQGSWSDQSWQQNTTAPQTPYKKRKLDEAGTAIPTHQSHQDSSTSAHTLPTTLSDVSFSPSGKQSGAPLDTPTSWKAAEGFHDVNYIARRQMPSTFFLHLGAERISLLELIPLMFLFIRFATKQKKTFLSGGLHMVNLFQWYFAATSKKQCSLRSSCRTSGP